jgi:hypothetical protein
VKSPYSNSVNCAACHVELLMPPLGKTAGLCPGLSCIQPAVLTGARLRDFNRVAGMILRGAMTAELEPETLVTWLAQVPPKPPRPAPCIYEDNGTPRFIQPGAPAGVTPLPGDLVLGGSDPALDKYRMTDDDDGQQ